jgi:hypothetical protein
MKYPPKSEPLDPYDGSFPIDAENPFPETDPRHAIWEEASKLDGYRVVNLQMTGGWLRRIPMPPRPRGAPKKPEAEKTRARWAEMGRPTKLTAKVCDELAEHTYPDEYARTRPQARKTLRDRVRRHVTPLISKPAGAAPAT